MKPEPSKSTLTFSCAKCNHGVYLPFHKKGDKTHVHAIPTKGNKKHNSLTQTSDKDSSDAVKITQDFVNNCYLLMNKMQSAASSRAAESERTINGLIESLKKTFIPLLEKSEDCTPAPEPTSKTEHSSDTDPNIIFEEIQQLRPILDFCLEQLLKTHSAVGMYFVMQARFVIDLVHDYIESQERFYSAYIQNFTLYTDSIKNTDNSSPNFDILKIINEKDIVQPEHRLTMSQKLFPSKYKLEMLFTPRNNGIGHTHFHEKCDGKGATLTVFSSDGVLYGAFTDQSWGSGNGSWQRSNQSFLYSFQSGKKYTLKPEHQQFATYNSSAHGVYFGNGDLVFHFNGKWNETLVTADGLYQHNGVTFGQENFGLTKMIEIRDYEVYKVTFLA